MRFKKFSHEEEQEPIWQVVYIDFLTVLTSFFLVLAFFSGKSQGDGDYKPAKWEIDSDSSFAKGRAEVLPELRMKIQNISEALKELPPDELLIISGHTDSDGSKMTNLGLGFSRAESLFREMARYNPQLQNQIALCSFADNRPIYDEKNVSLVLKTEHQKRNRRIEIELQKIKKPISSAEGL